MVYLGIEKGEAVCLVNMRKSNGEQGGEEKVKENWWKGDSEVMER